MAVVKSIDSAATQIGFSEMTDAPFFVDHFDFSIEGDPDRPMISGRALEYAQDQGALVLSKTGDDGSTGQTAFYPEIEDEVIVSTFSDDLGF